MCIRAVTLEVRSWQNRQSLDLNCAGWNRYKVEQKSRFTSVKTAKSRIDWSSASQSLPSAMSQPSSSRRSAAPAAATATASSSSRTRRPAGRVVADDEESDVEQHTQTQREEEDLDDLLAPLPKPQIDARYSGSEVGKDAALSKFQTLIREWKAVAGKIDASLETLAAATSDYVEAVSGSGAGSADEVRPARQHTRREVVCRLRP